MAIDNFDALLGGRQLGRQIGSGTNGRVYSLKDSDDEKKSVVKIIKLSKSKILETKDESCGELFSYSDEEYCKAFVKNITDNIDLVKSYDGGKRFALYQNWVLSESSDENELILLIQMEKLTPLSDFLGEYAFTEKEVLRMAACLCDSLDKCRDFGFIYPNLKPDNVMFDHMGRCKLGDLGTFCCVAPLRTSIAYKKTQQYMAPEFYKTDVINETCDTYSLGLVMYALLNRGRAPFLPTFPAEITMNELSKSLKQRNDGKAPPPPAVASDEVAAVVLKAISYDKRNRYKTPRQMLSDIRKLLNGEAVSFEPDEEVKQESTITHLFEPVKAESNSNQVEKIVYNSFDTVYKSYFNFDSSDENEEDINDAPLKKEIKSKSKPKSNTRTALEKNQRLILVLLAFALVALVVTVIVLGVKYAESQPETIFIFPNLFHIQQFETITHIWR